MSRTRTLKPPSASDQSSGQGDVHSTVMPVAITAAAISGGRSFAPMHAAAQVKEMAASLDFGSEFSPTPGGSSHPDLTQDSRPDPAQYRKNPNQEPKTRTTGKVRELLLDVNYMDAYIIRGTINARAVTFLVDTGATNVSIPERVAHYLGLEIMGRAQQSQTANGMVKVFPTQIEQLKIGEIVLKNVNASINTGDRSEQVLLGMSVLKELELVQREGKLLLRQYV